MKINQFYKLIDATREAHGCKNIEITRVSTERDGIFSIESVSSNAILTIKGVPTKTKKLTPAATDVSK